MSDYSVDMATLWEQASDPNNPFRASAYEQLVETTWIRGEFSAAIEIGLQWIAAVESEFANPVYLDAVLTVCQKLHAESRWREALQLIDYALTLPTTFLSPPDLGYLYWRQATNFANLDDLPSAEIAFRAALECFSEVPDTSCTVEFQYALLLIEQQRFIEAMTFLQSALEEFQARGTAIDSAKALITMAKTSFELKEFDAVEQYSGEAAAVYTFLGRTVEGSECELVRARALTALRRFVEATTLYENLSSNREHDGFARVAAEAQYFWSEHLRAIGEHQRADQMLDGVRPALRAFGLSELLDEA